MKKLLLLFAILPAGLLIRAQESNVPVYTFNPNQRFMHEERPVVLVNHSTGTTTTNARPSSTSNSGHHSTKSLRSLSSGIKLNHQAVGSAGNLLTVDNAGSVQLLTDSASNSVVFIHREDPNKFPLNNLAEYDYDISRDGGANFSTNIGPITINPRIDNNNVNGRFPQGAIYNPTGSSIADSAYLVYSGTWHNACGSCSGAAYTWKGQMRGVAQLDGDTSTYTLGIDTVNHGHNNIASSFCQSVPGTFWNINEDYSGYFAATGATQRAVVSGFTLSKGVWNNGTQTVDWTDTEMPQGFDSTSDPATGVYSIATSFDIAFDPSGQYGWISCLGDISPLPTAVGDSVYHPIFWYSQDGGNNWSGPIQLDLKTIPGVVANMDTLSKMQGGTTYIMSGVPTTTFEAKLAVDYLGNPHLFTTVANAAPYGVQVGQGIGGGYQAYDINYNATRPACDSNDNGWAATLIDSVETFLGGYSSDGVVEYNRPEVSRSADGKKLFFYWLDTDFNGPGMPAPGYDSNEFPNLITRALDIEHQTMTPVVNLTAGDSLFGGQTSDPNQLIGIYQPGANFPVIANTALQSGSSYNVGVILTQIDYTTFPDGGSIGSSANPAQFWYINNVTYDKVDFSVGRSATVQLVGLDTIVVLQFSSYIDSGAVILYTDTSCFNVGTLHLVTDSSSLNLGVTGNYTIYYTAEDANGNIYGGTSRTVEVVAAPVANFAWGFPYFNYQAYFTDQSTNIPTSWLWDFGDGSASTGQNVAQNPHHNYAHTNVYHVCLTATNAYGSNQKCKDVNVNTAINDIGLAEHINLYPNPSTGKVFIAVDANTVSDFSVSIFDMLGNTVVSPIDYKAGTSKVELNLGILATGTYMVKIQTGQDAAIKRLDLIRK